MPFGVKFASSFAKKLLCPWSLTILICPPHFFHTSIQRRDGPSGWDDWESWGSANNKGGAVPSSGYQGTKQSAVEPNGCKSETKSVEGVDRTEFRKVFDPSACQFVKDAQPEGGKLDGYVFLDPHSWVAGGWGNKERVSALRCEYFLILFPKSNSN